MAPQSASAAATTAFRTVARSRRSARRFQPGRVIPNPIIKDVLETTLTSPSGFNLQPTHAIVVRSPEMKERLAAESMLGAGNAFRTRDASALTVFVSDLEVHKRIGRIYELERESGARDPYYMSVMPAASSFLSGEGHLATWLKQAATDALSPIQPMPTVDSVQAWAYKNAGMMAQTYILACESHGLATCAMEGFDARRVKEALRIPDRFDVPLAVATGYSYEGEGWEEKRTPRLGLEEAFFSETFGGMLSLEGNEDETEEKHSR